MKDNIMKYSLLAEFWKIIYSKATMVVLPIILIVQPLLAYISSRQLLSVGLDAKPEAQNGLLEAVPPIEFFGFDSILIGLFAMIILGAVLGGSEYHNNSLRTTLLQQPDKNIFYLSKLIATLLFVFAISILSITLSIALSQLALGSHGLNPIILNAKEWYFITLSSISWTLLTILSYVIAFLTKTSIVSLIFLIPQLYNLGTFLADRVQLARLLPVSLGQDLIATTPTRLTSTPLVSIACLSLWIILFGTVAKIKFTKEDLGGE